MLQSGHNSTVKLGGADLVYVRKDGRSSTIKCLSNGETLLGLSRSTLNSEIDSSIFFAKSVILCEGYADELFLQEMATQLKIDLDAVGSMIVSTRGLGKFTNYSLLMNYFRIKYVILTDADGNPESRLDLKAEKHTGTKGTKFAILGEERAGECKVFFLKNNLEHFLMTVNGNVFQTAQEAAANEGRKDSKPLIVEEFLRRVSQDKKTALSKLVKPVFECAIQTG